MMMKQSKLWRAMAFASLGAVALTGCGGSDGGDGKTGEPGEPGPVGKSVLEATAIQPTITGVSWDEAGVVTVNFDLTDANGVALVDLKTIDIAGLSIGRIGTESEVIGEDLVDLEDTDGREIWLPYFTKTKGELEDETLFAGSNYFSGVNYNNTVVNCVDCLTDNGNGNYTLVTKGTAGDGSDYLFTINTNGLYEVKADVTNGAYLTVKVRYPNEERSEVHLENGDYLNNHDFFYWLPNSNTEQPMPKQVIADATCETCHRPEQDGNLGNMHHPGKHTVMESCTFCHVDYNEYGISAGYGEPITGKYDGSIKGLAHSIHGASKIYPQSIADCNACHTSGGEGEPSHAADWMADKDSATCRSCHTEAPARHGDTVGGPFDAKHYNCVTCHSDESFARGAVDAHFTTNAKQIGYALDVEASNPVFSADGSELSIDFVITNNGEAVPLANTNLATESKTLVVSATEGKDFVAAKLRNSGGAAVATETNGVITLTTSTAILDGAATMDIAELKAAVEGGATLAAKLIGKVCVLDGAIDSCASDSEELEKAYIVAGTTFFPESADSVQHRQQFSNMANCFACHNEGLKHYYTEDLDGCAMCHSRTRPKSDEPAMLARVVHSNHYIYRPVEEGEEAPLFFKKTECIACHEGGDFGLQNFDSASEPVAYSVNPDTDATQWISPQAAACISCHKPTYLGDAGIAHIETYNGQVLVESYDDTKVESCATCHTDEFILKAHSNFGASNH